MYGGNVILCNKILYHSMEEKAIWWTTKMFYVFKGGSGQRKTTPLPQGAEGYTAKVLKSSSNNGKNEIYIVPLQEKIDTTPLPYDAAEFERMAKNTCMTCGKLIPLPLIQFHIESCGDKVSCLVHFCCFKRHIKKDFLSYDLTESL